MMRWLFLVTKDTDPAISSGWLVLASKDLAVANPGEHDIQLSDAHFKEHAARLGGFPGWIEAVQGELPSGEPRFHGLITRAGLRDPIGKANYEIMEGFIESKRVVLSHKPGAGFFEVRSMQRMAGKDWKQWGTCGGVTVAFPSQQSAKLPSAAPLPTPGKFRVPMPDGPIAPEGRGRTLKDEQMTEAEFDELAKGVITSAEDLAARVPAATDFADSIIEKLEGMRSWAEENGFATAKMKTAAENMEAGIEKWNRGRDRP